MDLWEEQQLESCKSECRLVEDAITRALDGLTPESLDRGQWDYACGQLTRAEKILDTLKRRVLRVRTRRLSLPIPKHAEHDEG